MLDSKALTKIQSLILITVIAVAGIGGGAVYVILSERKQTSETIKIGILADLEMNRGEKVMNGAILAAEEINEEGGVLGRQIEIIGEDSDIENPKTDPNIALSALTRLITYDKVDFVLVSGGEDFIIDAGVVHKKIILGQTSPSNALTQRVNDDYDKYKYFFRLGINETTTVATLVDSLLHLREITGFNKIAYLAIDIPQVNVITESFNALPETHGFDLVYRGKYNAGTFDFTSYFAAAEAAGAEIMVPLTISQDGVALVKEWNERQSPMVLWGLNAYISGPNAWNNTEGKVEYTTLTANLLQLGFQATSKTLATQDAYLNRWGDLPSLAAVAAYDCIRFLLYDALERAQTTETEAVIIALENSDIENTIEENFKFTSSHDHYYESGSETALSLMFQWQPGEKKVIVYPKTIMEKVGATYMFPDWPGPWDDLD